MQSFTEAFNLDQKGKQLEFNIPQKKKNIFLRYPRTGFIVGLLFMTVLEFLLTDMTFSVMVLVTVATCVFMGFLWFVEKIFEEIFAVEKVFSGPAFLLSVLASFAVRGGLIVLSDDVLSPRIAFNMLLFSLICFSIVFLFKVKKAIATAVATGKLKWNQGSNNYNSGFSTFSSDNSPIFSTDPHYRSFSCNIYRSRSSSLFDS